MDLVRYMCFLNSLTFWNVAAENNQRGVLMVQIGVHVLSL